MSNGKAPCVYAAYTPVWEEDGKCFKAWIKIGSISWDEHGEMSGKIDALPRNREEDFTGSIRYVEDGAPPPAPLTVTKEEFLEAHLARE